MPITIFGARWFALQYTGLDMWLALCSVTPSNSDTGATIWEVTASDYARVFVDPIGWYVPNQGPSLYDTAISFSPTEYWGSINSWALLDSATLGAGNIYSYGSVSPQFYGATGSYIELPAGSITMGVEV